MYNDTHPLTNLIVLLGWCYLLSSCKLFCSLCIALLLAGCLQQILFLCGIIFVKLLSLPAVIRITILPLHNFFSPRLLLSLCVATFVGLHCVYCQMPIFFMFINFVVCLFVQLLAWTFESSAVRKQSWHWQQQCHHCAHG
jgi:hypothetical protein